MVDQAVELLFAWCKLVCLHGKLCCVLLENRWLRLRIQWLRWRLR